MQVTIYSLPSCMKCKIFMRKLDAEGVQYEKIDNEEETMKAGEESGMSSLPIVKIDNEWYNEQQARSMLGF